MEYEKLIEEHKDILEFRKFPYNDRAYIEEFLKLAEKKVNTRPSPIVEKKTKPRTINKNEAR